MRKVLQTHTIKIKLMDFSKDKHTPAYDVEVSINYKPVMGGGKKQIYLTSMRPRGSALNAAQARVRELLAIIKGLGEE